MGRPKKIGNINKTLPSSVTSALPIELEITPENIESIILTCDKVGLSREKCITAINDSLSATKITIDKYGQEHEEPDHDKRLKGALAGLELRGDFRSKTVGIDNSKHTHVTVTWGGVPLKGERIIDVD